MTAGLTRASRVPRWGILYGYVGVLIAAEALITYGDAVGAAGYQEAGLSVHIVLLFALILHSALVWGASPVLSSLLLATSLASLIRVFSLGIPPYTFSTIDRLVLVSAPFLAAILAVAYVQKLRLRDLGLMPTWRGVPVQVAIALTGVPLGLLEYAILRPGAWIPRLDASAFVAGAFAIFLATGISEELIFRGIMLRRAVEGLGRMPGLLFVSVTFTSLHIFFRSPADLAFVFGVALLYGYAVLQWKSLWGVIGSHSLANVVLYLLAPFFLAG